MKKFLGLLILVVVLSSSNIQVFADDDPEGGVIHTGGIISCIPDEACTNGLSSPGPNGADGSSAAGDSIGSQNKNQDSASGVMTSFMDFLNQFNLL